MTHIKHIHTQREGRKGAITIKSCQCAKDMHVPNRNFHSFVSISILVSMMWLLLTHRRHRLFVNRKWQFDRRLCRTEQNIHIHNGNDNSSNIKLKLWFHQVNDVCVPRKSFKWFTLTIDIRNIMWMNLLKFAKKTMNWGTQQMWRTNLNSMPGN